jgi:hypothetical protein
MKKTGSKKSRDTVPLSDFREARRSFSMIFFAKRRPQILKIIGVHPKSTDLSF